ncbi:MAG: DNA recombination protein RmuC [Candidatus Kerfeldbacteria bacterium]|nr:DNA recombination protein RmuC [Candidatus Kerfeldbacteria bacterium]
MDLLILGIIFVVGIVVAVAMINRRMKELTKGEDSAPLLLLNQNLQGMQQRLDDTSKSLQERLDRHTQTMQQTIQAQFGESAKIIERVTERLTKLDETNRQVVNFADQLQQLQDTLNNPKQRGVLGEYYLETVLKNVLPPAAYKMQYAFKDGEIVDAAIFVKEKIIPVDAKFSLENYNRISATRDKSEREKTEKLFKQDLKNRIDETSKYIRPSENTMDFAFMFIPAEAIYYDLLVNQVGAAGVSSRDLIDYAFKDKHVIIVSPTSFFAYLQTVLQGLRAMQIEESAIEIRKNIEVLAKHLQSYDVYMQKLGATLGTTVSHYNSAYKEFKKIDKDVVKIAEVESKVEPMTLEKPSGE